MGFKNGDRVNLVSHAQDGKRRVAYDFEIVAYDIPNKCAGAYFPETNVLVGIDEKAKRSLTPMSKYIEITLERR